MHAFFTILIGISLIITAPLKAEQSLPDNRRELFQWFNRLDVPDVTGCDYVRVATGAWRQSSGQPPQNTFVYGFLLKENGDDFTVLTDDLVVQTFTSKDDGLAPHKQVYYEKQDVNAAVGKYLQLLNTADEDYFFQRRLMGKQLKAGSEFFVMSWACYQNGLAELSRSLYSAIGKLYRLEVGKDGADDDDVRAVAVAVQKDLGHVMMWRAVTAFGDPEVSRETLLQWFKAIVKYYPLCEHADRARNAADLLQEMTTEDRQHRVASFTSLSKHAQVAELIFKLRDQNGHRWVQPGVCDIFSDPRAEKSPAHQLVKLGYEAVPQLIDALSDRRFTRSVSYWQNVYFSHRVLRIGDCALAILERISGQPFYSRTFHNEDFSVADKHDVVRQWWSDIQEKGEKRILIESVASGDARSVNAARLLVKKHPKDALQPLLEGIRQTIDKEVYRQFVQLIASLESDDGVAFLKQELANGRFLGSRVAAAVELFRQGMEHLAVGAMIREWNSVQGCKANESANDLECLISFLVTCGYPEAVAALNRQIRSCPIHVRMSVFSSFGGYGRNSVFSASSENIDPVEITLAGDRQYRENVERLLTNGLYDKQVRRGMSGTWDWKSFVDPRVCDVAAHVLSRLWPDVYDFDLDGTQKTREIQRIACINAWRQKKGLKALEPPEFVTITPIAKRKITASLQDVRASYNAESAKRALLPLERLGLPVLPYLTDLAAEISDNHPAYNAVINVLRRLSCRVTAVDASQLGRVGDELSAGLRAFKHKPLIAGAITQLLSLAARKMPVSVGGVELKFIRHDDLTGINASGMLIETAGIRTNDWSDWRVRLRIIVNQEIFHDATETILLDDMDEENTWIGIQQTIVRALISEPRTEIRIWVLLKRAD